ncbi:hypothetical protein PTET_b0392 [Pseudoalteromonas tetraodonis]|nr:hypothetical protein PTET_b0392 [Pseudoalteromonas tetraodonis]
MYDITIKCSKRLAGKQGNGRSAYFIQALKYRNTIVNLIR